MLNRQTVATIRLQQYKKNMMQGLTGSNRNAQDYWRQSSFSYKCCCLTSTIIFVFSMFIPALIMLIIDIPELTFWSFQVWRLFVCMYGQEPYLIFIISIVFSFIWLYNILKDSEYSTVYKFIEIFLINFEIHLVFNVICLLITVIFNTKTQPSYGWLPIILIYQFRNSTVNPEQELRFCCLPFLIKSKYHPWILLGLLVIIYTQFFYCFVACGILGYYQEVVRKDMFIKLPLWVYKKFQAIIPEQVKNRPDFVPISAVQGMLKTKCTEQIYKGQPVDFKSYWAQKDLDSSCTIINQIQPENIKDSKLDQNIHQNQNNSFVRLNNRLLDELQEQTNQYGTKKINKRSKDAENNLI